MLQVSVGNKTYVCVTMSPLNWYNNGTYLRVASEPRADEISSVNIRNCEDLLDVVNLKLTLSILRRSLERGRLRPGHRYQKAGSCISQRSGHRHHCGEHGENIVPEGLSTSSRHIRRIGRSNISTYDGSNLRGSRKGYRNSLGYVVQLVRS
jgi:hypothetical protein